MVEGDLNLNSIISWWDPESLGWLHFSIPPFPSQCLQVIYSPSSIEISFTTLLFHIFYQAGTFRNIHLNLSRAPLPCPLCRLLLLLLAIGIFMYKFKVGSMCFSFLLITSESTHLLIIVSWKQELFLTYSSPFYSQLLLCNLEDLNQ